MENEERARSFSLSKWVYLFALLAFVVWLLYTLFGHLFFFQAEGLVVREQNRISVPYPARVAEMSLDVGDRVKKGQTVARVHSLTIRETMAKLQLQMADNRRERSRLKARRAELEALIPVARRRADRMEEILGKSSEAYTQGLTTLTARSNLIEDEFAAAQDLARFRAEKAEIDRQMRLIDEQQQDLRDQYALFADAYDDGEVRAPAAGHVYDIAITQGGVVRAADPIMTIVSGAPYILAYADPGGFDEIRVGEAVDIEFGVRKVRGTVTRLLPLSKQVPEAFQRAFQPQQRSQLIRIDFTEGVPRPPTFSNVRISAHDILPNWFQDWFRAEKSNETVP